VDAKVGKIPKYTAYWKKAAPNLLDRAAQIVPYIPVLLAEKGIQRQYKGEKRTLTPFIVKGFFVNPRHHRQAARRPDFQR